ncbi:mRNA splicing protein PRP28 KNAG_0A04130 [Huiozyma naganishii CBS 8797]|uniref:RNA helicase n=1 Tax=Huiozyma naganishii (strain ATCC MYA-139 / BCRC 22969 / CBS 8797 / KCTC 17520 / NBRC 10181 / NCYC 3082 / Yp74L-3) TaxID=1071383 RepID=J7RTM2_HUIN7|nr:hypothetical protein KNAG_0A04130 [Kazachstania naganishii CBS 8797]CCK68092.1 hypothetical protein KNAG_0A04130 [Kazachstania naganishii CBS 8797]
MTRPVNIDVLLGKLGGRPSGKQAGKVEKPRLLSRLGRGEKQDVAVAHYSQNTQEGQDRDDDYIHNIPMKSRSYGASSTGSVVVRETEVPINTSSGRKTGGRDKGKGKFNFDWKQEDDTLLEQEPIVSKSSLQLVKNLYSKTQEHDRSHLMDNYMGEHWTVKPLDAMTAKDWRHMKEKYHIMTKNSQGSVQNPLRTWQELGLIPPKLLNVLTRDLQFVEPSPIQRIAIPNIVHQPYKDLIGVSSTGSGKTVAFAVPILIKMNGLIRPRSLKLMEGPKALILAPTRELVQQIESQIKNVTTRDWTDDPNECTVVSIVGGHSLEELTNSLRNGCDILVATPGRLIDCLENHILTISNIDTLVLDEADKMIDLGFEDQLKLTLSKVNVETKHRAGFQTLMFTATLSPAIELISHSYLQSPIHILVDSGEGSQPQVKQIVRYSPNTDQRFVELKAKVLPQFKAPIIIFINYKNTADWLAQKFQQETAYKVTILHGSKSQEQREHSLQLLRTGKAQIMIATNIAARGLDIPNVSLVINFQMSKNFDDYVHRIGRTGRAGNSGTAITFVGDEEDQQVMKGLYQYVKDNNPTGANEFSTAVEQVYTLNDKTNNLILF